MPTRADKDLALKRHSGALVTMGRHAHQQATKVVSSAMGSRQLAKTVSTSAAKRFAQWRAALFQLQDRARSEISSLNYTMTKLTFNSPASELLPLRADAEAAKARALAISRGLLPQLTGGPAESHATCPGRNAAPIKLGAIRIKSH